MYLDQQTTPSFPRRPMAAFPAADPAGDKSSPRQLVERIARRDEAAMADLYQRYAAALFAIALRLLRRREDAEEVLQETFLEVWSRAPDYDPTRSSVSTWLMLICRSRTLDRLRARATSRRTLLSIHHEPTPPPAVERAEGIVLGERRRSLRRALAKLPREQRQTIALAFGCGLTQAQISRRLGIPLGTVKTRTYLGMAKLRRALASRRGELL